MASPYPMGDFHLLFFASFLAHSEMGQVGTDLDGLVAPVIENDGNF